MKLSHEKVMAFFCILLTAVIMSCKKANNSGTCTLVSIQDSSDTHNLLYTLSYDQHGNLLNLSATEGNIVMIQRTFQHNGNSVIINSYSNGLLYEMDTMQLNNEGSITEIRKTYADTSLPKYVLKATYDSFNRLKSFSVNNGEPQYTIWQGGDMIQEYNSTGTINYSYLDKQFSIGDGYALRSYLYYGAFFQKTAHLLASYGYETFNYEFDTKGNVNKTTILINGNETEQYSLNYSCP